MHFLGWVEAFPTRTERASEVAWCLLREIVPRFGFPTSIGSDNVKKEFIGPGLHLRHVRADHARPPLQWTLNSVLSACGNDNGRIRPLLGRGILKITSRLLIA